MESPEVKIFITYHKKAKLFHTNTLIPIHAGRDIAHTICKEQDTDFDDSQWLIDNMAGDNTGENISHLNRFFCEMTTIYWVWKNIYTTSSPQYIGHFLYRKHLNFKQGYTQELPRTPLLKRYPDNYCENFGITDDNIINTVKNRDAIFCSSIIQKETVYEQFSNINISHELDIEYLDHAVNYIKNNYSEYYSSAFNYLNSKYHYWGNCFIMKSSLFNRYCKFIFDILLDIYKNFDPSKKNIAQARIIGHVAERLLGIFITKLKDEKKDILFLAPILIKNAQDEYKIIQFYKGINTSIVYCVDHNYAKYMAVSINSLICNSNDYKKYDIVVLHSTLPKHIIKKIYSLTNSKKNINIRFYNISSMIEKYIGAFPTRKYWSFATYYRFFIPNIFSDYKKVLYLDCDTIILDDVYKIIDIDFTKEELLAAAFDIGMARYIDSYEWIQYTNKILKITDIEKYFQAAVILFNIPQMKKFHIEEKLISFSKKYDLKYLDQDALNHVSKDRILWLDLKWNVPWSLNAFYMEEVINNMPIKYATQYIEAIKNPSIIHFCNVKKPWNFPEYPNAHFFWKYARHTPFYEEIMFAALKENSKV